MANTPRWLGTTKRLGAPDPSWPEAPPGWEMWVPQAKKAQDDPPLAEETSASIATLPETQTGSTEENVELNDAVILQEAGIYRYHHPLENSVEFKAELKVVEIKQTNIIKAGLAIKVSQDFSYENSVAKGQKLSSDLSKLMLRAYNAEAENCIRTIRAGNIATIKRRLERTLTAIGRLGKIMQMQISHEYHELKLKELELTSDFFEKKKEEKEQLRDERARLREDKRAAMELESERERLYKEKQHLVNALEAIREGGRDDDDLAKKLHELEEAIEQNDYRIANIRSGYVYVISNKGAFGENIVKIGLTRRLDPRDRITELSGASVPFRFDVHALFFSEDAVTLETELHNHFRDRSLNQVNLRKEFFFASPKEVEAVLIEKVGNLLEFNEAIESEEYFQSLKYWPEIDR